VRVAQHGRAEWLIKCCDGRDNFVGAARAAPPVTLVRSLQGQGSVGQA
jgi:hypothetical protein